MSNGSGSFRLPKFKLSAADAQERVRWISWHSENVIFTDHAQERMEERGISMPEVLEVLRCGYVDDPPIREIHGDWKCKVTMKYQTGRTIGVVTVIMDAASELIIVTIEWEDLR
jgi:Domain of unknown function (DUF4258)